MMLTYLFLDVLIYNYTSYNSFFFLLSLLTIDDKEYIKVIILGLLLDLIIFNLPYINTTILLLLFIINKKIIKIKDRSLKTFLYLILFDYFVYIFFLIMLNRNLNFTNFIISIIINIIFYVLSYNNLKKYIKLSR